MMVKTIFNDLLNLFFPNLCVVCKNKLAEGEQFICLECLLQLPKAHNWNEKDNKLEQFFAGRFPFERIASFAHFVKGGSMQQIIHELKYRNNPKIGQFIGQLCGEELASSQFIHNIDYIVPVPLHPKRQKQRGYNQSLEVARGISEKTNIAIDSETLIRTVNNQSQTKNSRFDRWKNVENIFTVTNPDMFKRKHILLIDDVITTGSTLESCAKEILKCHASKLSIFALASAD
jgi:ComF family protein